MSDGQKGDSGYSVEEEEKFYSTAETNLAVAIDRTDNVTLLKKIYSSGILRMEAFDRMLELMVTENPDACLEVMKICKKSKELSKKMENKMAEALSDGTT